MNKTAFDSTGHYEAEIHDQLGKEIITWQHKKSKSNKFLVAAIGLIIALVIFTIFYGPRLLPWLKSVATWIQYLVIISLTPLIKYVSSLGRDRRWSLYENGYLMQLVHQGKIIQQKMGFWKDYTKCEYDQKGVILIPRISFRGKIRINTTTNRMEVYSIVRERISMAHAESLQAAVKAPERPNTKEQRRIQRMEQWNKWLNETKKSSEGTGSIFKL